MHLLALRCGDLRTDAGVLFDGPPSGTKADVPIMTHAVDTGDGVLLWDTGIDERCLSDLGGYLGPIMAKAFEAVGTPDSLMPARVEQAGFAVDDIRWVVNSHLHFDHCGCNRSYPVSSWVVRDRAGGGLLPLEGGQPRVRARGGGCRARAATPSSTTTANTT